VKTFRVVVVAETIAHRDSAMIRHLERVKSGEALLDVRFDRIPIGT
jgi:hypothetical protein